MNEESLKVIFKKYLKDLKRRKNIKNYYIKEMKGGKTYGAVLLDSIFLKALMIIWLFIYIVLKTRKFLLSLVITLGLFSIALYVNYYFKTNRYNKKVIEINKDIVKKKIIREISYFTNYEFIQYIKELLEKHYNISFTNYEKDIDLIGKKEGEVWAVKCFKTSQEERIVKKDMEDFKNKVSETGIEREIIVTNSYFADVLKEEYEEETELIDFDSLISIIKEIGDYPSNKEIEEIIISRYEENKRRISKEKEPVFSKTKIFRYLFLSFCLLILSNMTVYKSYYIVMAFISLALGMISIFYEFFYKFISEETEEE